ncbi:MAG: hypothetical protein WA966_08455 [Ornithinimicrobium sp.]
MSTLQWLLDSDPALRWQVLRDLTDASPDEVAAERSRVAREGWGARLLSLRAEDGQWAGGACFPAAFRGDFSTGQPWTSTFPTLTLLRQFGVDPQDPQIRDTVELVAANCRWEHEGQRFFDGEVEPCINGQTVSIGAYFGADVTGIVARLLTEQLEDGGWNCEAERGSVRSSFHTTICVVEGLLEHERAHGASPQAREARRRGERYLLERRLLRRLSTGEQVDAAFTQFSFPPWWHYDALRALDHFRAAGDPPHTELAEGIELVRSKQQPDGTWLLEGTHRGDVHFELEDGDGRPSRWNTVRALRVLRWYDAARADGAAR